MSNHMLSCDKIIFRYFFFLMLFLAYNKNNKINKYFLFLFHSLPSLSSIFFLYHPHIFLCIPSMVVIARWIRLQPISFLLSLLSFSFPFPFFSPIQLFPNIYIYIKIKNTRMREKVWMGEGEKRGRKILKINEFATTPSRTYNVIGKYSNKIINNIRVSRRK